MACSFLHWNACHIPQNFRVSQQFPLQFLYASWKNYCFKFDSNWYSDESIKTPLAVLSSLCSIHTTSLEPTRQVIRNQNTGISRSLANVIACICCKMNNTINSSVFSLSFHVSKLKTRNCDLKVVFFFLNGCKISKKWQTNKQSLSSTLT